jgi:carbonic anhydrase
MDSRYPHRIIQTMDSRGLRGKYDQLILAGASLGVVHKGEWTTTFLDQLAFAIKEHGVTEVMILDHRDCGAFKKLLKPGVGPEDPKKEKAAHIKTSKEAIDVIKKKCKEIKEVHCLLLPIETVEELASWP